MSNNVYLIINESHELFLQQEQLMKEKFEDWYELRVPASGWTRKEMDQIMERYFAPEEGGRAVAVFASPVPYLLQRLSYAEGAWSCAHEINHAPHRLFCEVWLFHNDRREKKELPNGRVIMTVPAEGWELV